MMGVEMDPAGGGLHAVSIRRDHVMWLWPEPDWMYRPLLRVETWYVWTDCMEFA